MPKTFTFYTVNHPTICSLIFSRSGSRFNPYLQNKVIYIAARMASNVSESDDDVDLPSADVRKMKPTILRRRLTEAWNKLLDISGVKNFGPSGMLMENMGKRPKDIDIEDVDSSLHLAWRKEPRNVLIVKKPGDIQITEKFKEVSTYLINKKGLTVHVEEKALTDPALEKFGLLHKIFPFEVAENIDFVICLGGDGTFLYSTSLFTNCTPPPIMCFGMGSLGFLTHFDAANFQDDIDRVTNKYMSITLRNRISASIIPFEGPCPPDEVYSPENSPPHGVSKPDDTKDERQIFSIIPVQKKKRAFLSNTGEVTIVEEVGIPRVKTFTCINEVTVDRGVSPFLIQVEIYLNDFKITTAQADGIIIATPTGSTAYSLAAGASILHPSTEAFIITPICPHSLSFRPIVVPNGVEVKLKLAECSRHNAWISFDGRDRQEVTLDDSIVLKLDPHPIPCLNNTGHVSDWFKSLINGLNWNVREAQKKL